MSHAFRELLRKIGSGPHTGKDLTREEAAAATRMMLLQEATPAQIGAFMIAHRIKRPTGEELAGMLDAYDDLSFRLQPIASSKPVLVMNSPYDGRDRTVPLSPLTALILSSVGQPVVLHGGDRMPTKEGVPFIEIWQGLGIDWSALAIEQVHSVLQNTGVGFVYLPKHFPLAQGLVPYREQIGKRPPFATLELMWSPYAGEAHIVVGFVHPPTENMARSAFALRETHLFTTVKGLEGSCDLPRERTSIIGLSIPDWKQDPLPDPQSPLAKRSEGTPDPLLVPLDRLHLSPHDYGISSKNVAFESTEQAIAEMLSVLKGEPSELMQSVIWNSGFYLWRSGICNEMSEAIDVAKSLLVEGKVMDKLKDVREAIDSSVIRS